MYFELKPCPFCGGVARLGTSFDDCFKQQIKCTTCYTEVNFYKKDEADAMTAWNKRFAEN